MNQDLLLILVVLLVLAALLRVWTRRRVAMRASQQPGVRSDAPEDALTAPRMPPRYEAARDAIAGPSLRVSISIVSLRDDALMVSWNATNNGSLPVAVQWGAPELVAENDLLQLRYTQAASGITPFVAPEVRIYQPGEILSRSITIAREAAGQELRGARVNVAVGYGNAEEFDAACTDQGVYLDWQRVAVSPPRSVPRS